MYPQRDTPLEARVTANETKIAALERTVNGNGQPGLETRVMAAVEAAKIHAKGNYQQGDVNILALLRTETEERNRQHTENKETHDADKKELKESIKELCKKVESSTRLQYGMVGAYVLWQVLRDTGVVPHLAK